MYRKTNGGAAAVTVAALVALAACSKGSDAAPPAPPSDAPAALANPHTATAAGDVAAPEEAGLTFTGTVLETINLTESKTMYLRLQTDAGERWVAGKLLELNAGDKVKVSDASAVKAFASPTLKRTFDELFLAQEIEKVP